jgi:hypothetical protein
MSVNICLFQLDSVSVPIGKQNIPVGALKGQSLAQNRENGKIPSLESSCFTRGIAKDWANTLPSADREMNTGNARVTNELSPQT